MMSNSAPAPASAATVTAATTGDWVSTGSRDGECEQATARR
jgi:hypothetical protein